MIQPNKQMSCSEQKDIIHLFMSREKIAEESVARLYLLVSDRQLNVKDAAAPLD